MGNPKTVLDVQGIFWESKDISATFQQIWMSKELHGAGSTGDLTPMSNDGISKTSNTCKGCGTGVSDRG